MFWLCSYFLLYVRKQSIIIVCSYSLGVSSFFDSLSHSLRENIAHVATAAAAVASDAPEPVFDRMQVVNSTYQRERERE